MQGQGSYEVMMTPEYVLYLVVTWLGDKQRLARRLPSLAAGEQAQHDRPHPTHKKLKPVQSVHVDKLLTPTWLN